MSQYSAPRGTEDLLPEQIPLFDHVLETCRKVLEQYAYLEIRPPLFEETSLFVRSLGEVTDVVEKEMFTCQRGDTSVTFRPEATASVVRAYLQNHLDKTRPFRKLYYIGPMFRFERPQAARQRQFHQVGIEAIGSHDPRLDAEVIHVAATCVEALGIQGFTVHMNSIGNAEDRVHYKDALKSFLEPQIQQYCKDCQRRYERNIFRVLDCKERECKKRNTDAPAFLDVLCEESATHFAEVQQALGALNREFEIDKGIIRGLDYYTHTVFEIRLPSLGARDTIVGGGRYDGLIEEMGGQSTPAIGFSLGVTGVLLAMGKQGLAEEHLGEPPCPVYVASLGEEDRASAFVLAEGLRRAGLTVDLDFEGRRIKPQLRQAAKRGARVVLIIGEDERARQVVQVKDMEHSEQIELPNDGDLPTEIQRILERDRREDQ